MMAFGGETAEWSDLFPDGLIPEVLKAILKCWDLVPRQLPNEHEVPITRRLREELRKEKNCRRLPFTVWPESSETDPITGKEVGRIDLRFLHGHREEVYLAFECKRLRIRGSGGGIQSNTSDYVGEDGMMRHLSGKYSSGLKDSGMIGYVMDGKVSEAKQAIRQALVKGAQRLWLLSGTGLEPSSCLAMDLRLAETQHECPDRLLRMHHVFLAV